MELVKVLGREEVGCVCGELRYVNHEHAPVGENESLYWKYEQFCKRRESMLGSLLGVNGAIYAVRREAFIHMEHDIIRDLIFPMRIYENGWEVRYTHKAVGLESTTTHFTQEFARKKRIIAQSLYGVFRHKRFLNPFRFGFFAVEIWSHKLIRWFVPVFMLLAFIANIPLTTEPAYRLLFVLQVIFYLLAGAGWATSKVLKQAWFLTIPFYFVTINLASLYAIILFMSGKRFETWRTVRQNR
jgi:hypothetical protein